MYISTDIGDIHIRTAIDVDRATWYAAVEQHLINCDRYRAEFAKPVFTKQNTEPGCRVQGTFTGHVYTVVRVVQAKAIATQYGMLGNNTITDLYDSHQAFIDHLNCSTAYLPMSGAQ